MPADLFNRIANPSWERDKKLQKDIDESIKLNKQPIYTVSGEEFDTFNDAVKFAKRESKHTNSEVYVYKDGYVHATFYEGKRKNPGIAGLSTDGQVHEAIIVEPKVTTTIASKPTTNNSPLGVNISLGMIDVIGRELEKQHGLEGLGVYDYLQPHINAVIKESPLGLIPNSVVEMLGKVIVKKWNG